MRTEPFEVKDRAYDNDDIQYAFEYNGLRDRLHDIQSIVAEVPGENDGYNWHWILLMKDGSYSYATGGCDYTGWDCQSSAEIHDGFATAERAAEESPEEEYGRKIQETLIKQINGYTPFAVIEL